MAAPIASSSAAPVAPAVAVTQAAAAPVSPAVFRIKRKRTEDPAEALLLCCKKPKDNSTNFSEEPTNVVFNFAGTLSRKDEPILTHIQLVQQRTKFQPARFQGLQSRASKQQLLRKANRFQLVNEHRDIPASSSTDENGQPMCEQSSICLGESSTSTSTTHSELNLFKLYDAVRDVDESHDSKKDTLKTENKTNSHNNEATESLVCNSVKMIREKLKITDEVESEYVYDLYYTENHESHLGLNLAENYFVVEKPYNFCGCSEEGDSDNGLYADDDDSNDEGNYRNDYPDEDDMKVFDSYGDAVSGEYFGCEGSDQEGELSSDEDYGLDCSDYRYRHTEYADVVLDYDEEDGNPSS